MVRKSQKEPPGLGVKLDLKLPDEVRAVGDKLIENKFKAYLVGGCVRDLLIHQKPKDWDIATDATPEEIQKIFTDSVYENTFGTVGVKTDSENPELKIVEVTTFRKEGEYSDSRHPDEVVFTEDIVEDLARRDFTVNAIAIAVDSGELVDPFRGITDLKNKVLRAVGEPKERFKEDALRIMRAVRLSAQLGFEIEEKTLVALKPLVHSLEAIAKERIRDEFVKIIMTERAAEVVELMEALGILKYVVPELRDGIGVGQNKHHVYTVFEHNVKALDYAAKKGYSLDVRLSCLLHDVGKPKTKRGEGPDSTFYGHQVVGERIARKVMERLRFSRELTQKVALLVREHMFVYDPEMVTLAGVRRLLARVGAENMDDLMKLREGDRIGSGVPKAKTYRLRHLEAMVEKVKTDPVSPKMVKVTGDDLIKELKMTPGPRMGKILAVLLEMVLDNPELNDKPKLLEKAIELEKMSDKDLDNLGAEAKRSADKAQERIDEEIKKKYFVK